MSFFDQVADWIRENPGKTVGALAGGLIGILIFTIGWWKAVIVIVCIIIGFLIGKSRDDNISIIDEIVSIFRRNRD